MHIKNSRVENSILFHLSRGEEAERTKLLDVSLYPQYINLTTYPVLYGNSNEAVTVRIDDLAHILLPVTSTIAPTMDPNKDWKLPSVLEVGRIHVKEEAVFTARW